MFLAAFYLVYVFFFMESGADVEIVDGPQNVTVVEGETATFICVTTGTFARPSWIIDGAFYSSLDLPPRHSFHKEQLIVSNVKMSDNASTYQCALIPVLSDIATLIVITDNPSMSPTTMATTESSITTDSINSSKAVYTTTMGSIIISNLTTLEPLMSSYTDYDESNHNSKSLFISTSVGFGALLLVLLLLVITIILYCCYKRYKFRGAYTTYPTQEVLGVASSNHYEFIEPQTAQSDNAAQLQIDSSSLSCVPIYDNIPADMDDQVYSRLSYNFDAHSRESWGGFRMEQQDMAETIAEVTDADQYNVLDHQVQDPSHQTEDQYDVIAGGEIEICEAQEQNGTLHDFSQGTYSGGEKHSCEMLYSIVNKEKDNSSITTETLALNTECADTSEHADCILT